MNKNEAILKQRIAAAVLLAVFLFIHIVKVLHHHDRQFANSGVLEKGTPVFKSTDCSVCDYHFVKDASNTTAQISVNAPIDFNPVHATFLYQRLTSIGLSSSDRGPPAVV